MMIHIGIIDMDNSHNQCERRKRQRKKGKITSMNSTHAHVNKRKLQAVKTTNDKKDFNSFDIINYG